MKKTIFSFFPLREVLGLGLKILFHKNKEIKRMLSKKMAFSLTSLITILALAFVVTPAMAQDFGVSIDMTGDKSSAGGLQLEHPVGDGEIKVTVKFDQAVKLDAATVFITTYDENGKLVSIPVATGDPAKTVATKEVVLTIPIKADSYKVSIKIAEGIAAADPISTKKSKKLDTTVTLIGEDEGGPTVYSIERVGTNFRQIVTPKINPTANPTVQVRVTLSEFPKAFGKTHISASNADVTTVTALVPEMGSSLVDFLADDDTPDAATKDLTRKRMMYDEDIAAEIDDATGSSAPFRLEALETDDNAAERKAKVDARTKHGGIHRAINEAGDYKYKEVPALTEPAPSNDAAAVPIDLDPEAADKVFGTDYILLNYTGDDTAGVMAAPGKPGDAVAKPTAPDVTQYTIEDAFAAAVRKYAVAFEKYRVYQNKKTLYDGYMAHVAAEEMKDDDKRAEEYADKVGRADQGPVATGSDMMLYPYLVTITPKYLNTSDIVVKVKSFEDRSSPVSLKYIPPVNADDYVEGVDMLTIEVAAAKTVVTTAGIEVVIGKGVIIPKDGYLVIAKNIAGSAVRNPGTATKAPVNPPRKPFGLTYNLVAGSLPNLEILLTNGATIDVVGPKQLVISEIMWGSDASLANSFESQYIELRNTSGAAITAGAADTATEYKLVLYSAGSTPPDKSVAANNIQDRVATVSAAHGRWAPLGKGRSGRTGVGESPGDAVAIAPTQSVISMQRTADATSATGLTMDGTDPMSWGESVAPGVNFDPNVEGERVGSPGRAPTTYPTEPTVTPPTVTVPPAVAADIVITEIMVDTDSGRLPQWIELTHVGTAEVSLDGWEMVVDNAIDADVIGGGNAITVSLSGATLDVSAHTGNTGKGQSVLVVAWAASRHSANIGADRIINIATQLNQTRRYQLLSYSGFRITLVPPQTGAIAAFGDVAGNLDEEWEIPMDEGTTRSSMIRREMAGTPAAVTMGTDANGWMLASSTALITGQQSYYGSDEDAGTPGQDAGGPLPVELSHFRPARDKTTGAVVITWLTQSELNNAGFFIKRSNQRNGQFVVVNPTMIPGAGTTSEKQFYTYTDTTAQPNVVYYYQIEDVSLDGNRQRLTNGIRLKGHIGAAGKLTSTWGELKTSNE